MNQYTIIREDLLVDPVTIITEGLLIGRLPQCELLLNHPSVSRVQAGIKYLEESYYLFALRPKNPVLLNGKRVEENEALAAGDIIEVGPFQLQVDSVDDGVVIRVEVRIGMKPSEIDVSDPGLTTGNLDESDPAKAKKSRAAPIGPRKRSTSSGTNAFVTSRKWRARRRFIRKQAGVVAKRNTSGLRRRICCRVGRSRSLRGRCWLSD